MVSVTTTYDMSNPRKFIWFLTCTYQLTINVWPELVSGSLTLVQDLVHQPSLEFFFPKLLKSAPRALGGPGATWGPYVSPICWAPWGALGPPYFHYLGLLLLLTTAATMVVGPA